MLSSFRSLPSDTGVEIADINAALLTSLAQIPLAAEVAPHEVPVRPRRVRQNGERIEAGRTLRFLRGLLQCRQSAEDGRDASAYHVSPDHGQLLEELGLRKDMARRNIEVLIR